ncbi:hypothetical protein HELRODRAFT_176425 [Helobdella robusta]|uniref:Uncharacterized protein n=1 Tax=Helobdella robusta TaxID=6412 RepID=T1FAH9_HELRO|nr:hypothetical protein HELRODRAFT_176425 [Helobdella robusta]ESO00114.1 hypothetical protein HELRODRAFT_176425 [Helobdella robusta]
MDGRKKLSGAEYKRIAKEKRKKESDVLSLTPKLETLFNKSSVNRSRMKRKMADELCNDEALTSVENMYQLTMLEIIDRVITELSDRFESLNNVNSMFGFLNDVKIEEMQTADLKIKAENLANIYSADLNIDEFMFEIESFKHHALTVDKSEKQWLTEAIGRMLNAFRFLRCPPKLVLVLLEIVAETQPVEWRKRKFSSESLAVPATQIA